MTRRSRLPQMCRPEPLELRALLAVSVSFNAGSGVLKIKGTGAGDRIDIDGTGVDGGVEVFVEGVKVNDFAGVRTINANLRNGNDELFLSALAINGDVIARFGAGSDELDVDGFINVGAGPDGNTVIGGSIKASFGGDTGDFGNLDDGVQISGNVTFSKVADVDINGNGSNATNEPDDVDVGGNFRIDFSGQGDQNGDNLELDVDNLNIFGAGKLTINGSSAVERVEITRSRFVGDFEANMDDGNDVVDIDNGAVLNNVFQAAALFDGGDDSDTLFKGIDNTFALPEVIENFETFA